MPGFGEVSQGRVTEKRSNDAALARRWKRYAIVLVEAIDEMLVVQRGKELGYTLGDAQFKTVLDNIRTRTSSRTRRSSRMP